MSDSTVGPDNTPGRFWTTPDDFDLALLLTFVEAASSTETPLGHYSAGYQTAGLTNAVTRNVKLCVLGGMSVALVRLCTEGFPRRRCQDAKMPPPDPRRAQNVSVEACPKANQAALPSVHACADCACFLASLPRFLPLRGRIPSKEARVSVDWRLFSLVHLGKSG